MALRKSYSLWIQCLFLCKKREKYSQHITGRKQNRHLRSCGLGAKVLDESKLKKLTGWLPSVCERQAVSIEKFSNYDV